MSITQTTVAGATTGSAGPQLTKGGVGEPQGFKRTIQQRFDVPGTNYETVIVFAELAANATTGRHQHPGIESAFVTEGDGTIFVDKQSAVALRAGQSYKLPFGVAHEMKSGPRGMKAVATWTIEKGKPIASVVS
jgi:quercetin dioxygenase-like cupin family protein